MISDGPPMASGEQRELTEETLPHLWLELVGRIGGMLGPELKKTAIPAIIGPNSLVLRFAEAYNQSRESIQDPLKLTRITSELQKLTGKSWQVKVEAEKSRPTSPGTPTESNAAPPGPKRTTKEEAEKIPLVKRALEVFGASFKRLDENFGQDANEKRLADGEEA